MKQARVFLTGRQKFASSGDRSHNLHRSAAGLPEPTDPTSFGAVTGKRKQRLKAMVVIGERERRLRGREIRKKKNRQQRFVF